MTELVLQVLQRKREELRDGWEEGDHTAESAEGTVQLNSAALAQAKTLAWVCKLDFETMKGELE